MYYNRGGNTSIIMIKINDTYSIIKGSDNPLSCDCAIIDCKDCLFVIEAGNSEEIVNELNSIKKDKILAITHFHQDHLSSYSKINHINMYIGDNTYKYTNEGIIVDKDMYVNNIHLFKLSSCHAKGSIGIEIGEYCFIGDGLAQTFKKNNYVYNVQMLKEEIDELSKLNAKYLVSSHKMDEPELKEEVIIRLTKIYQRREKNNPYIICINK